MNNCRHLFILLQLWICSYIGFVHGRQHPLQAAGKWSFREPEESTVWNLVDTNPTEPSPSFSYRFSLLFSPDLKSSIYKKQDRHVRKALRSRNKVVIGLYRKSWFSFSPVFEQLMSFDELNEFSSLRLNDSASDRVTRSRIGKIKSGAYVLKAYIKTSFNRKKILAVSHNFHIRKIGVQDESNSGNVLNNVTVSVKPDVKYSDKDGLALRVPLRNVLKQGKQIQFTLVYTDTNEQAVDPVYIKAANTFEPQTTLKLSMNMPKDEGSYQLVASVRSFTTMYIWKPVFISEPQYLIATNLSTPPINTSWLRDRTGKLEPIKEIFPQPERHSVSFNQRYKDDTGYENRPGRGMDPMLMRQLEMRQTRRRFGMPSRSQEMPFTSKSRPSSRKQHRSSSSSKRNKKQRSVRFAEDVVDKSKWSPSDQSTSPYYLGPSTADMNDYPSLILDDDFDDPKLYYPPTESTISVRVTPERTYSAPSSNSLRESSMSGVSSHPIDMLTDEMYVPVQA